MMEPLISGDDGGALTLDEEKQFRNMVNRLHTIFKVDLALNQQQPY